MTPLAQIIPIMVWVGLVLPLAEGHGAEPERGQVPADTAILELAVPAGATVTVDGKEQDPKQPLRYKPLAPSQRIARDVRVRFKEGGEIQKTVYLQGGWQVRLPIMSSRTSRPELVVQTGHATSVFAVAFRPDGQHLLTGSDDKTAILWETRTGQKLRSFQGHTGRVMSVAFRLRWIRPRFYGRRGPVRLGFCTSQGLS